MQNVFLKSDLKTVGGVVLVKQMCDGQTNANKGLSNVGAVQVGNLDVTLKDMCVKRLQCYVTVDATQTLLVTINKLL
jgi:hypothetical protein